MDLPYKTAEKTSSKSEANTEETASGGHAVSLSTSSAGEEQKALKEPETFSTQHAAKVLKHRLRVCLIWQTKHTSHAASVLQALNTQPLSTTSSVLLHIFSDHF